MKTTKQIIEEAMKGKGILKDMRMSIVCIRKALNIQKEEFLKEIDDVSLELMFTDIKNNKNEVVNLSGEVMDLITMWWNIKSKELEQKLKDGGLDDEK